MSSHSTFESWNGINISTETRKRFADFEAQYSHLREQEGRILSPDEIRRLPVTDSDQPFHREWEMRRNTIANFLTYLQKKKGPLSVLDLGCGNGFFSALIAKQGHEVAGVDVCLFELEQASKIFGSQNPTWYYADFLSDKLHERSFDLITFNASFQYFSKPAQVIAHALTMLGPNGEIHILESPFYENEDDAEAARQKSLKHFQEMGSPGMIGFYHFNTWSVLQGFEYEVQSKNKLLSKLIGKAVSPFPWIVIAKT